MTALIWFLAKFLRYAFPPLFGTFQSTYGVSNSVVGTAFTALMLAYAAMQFPSGLLADRVGGVRVVTAGAIVAAVASLALTISLPFGVLVAVMVLVGVGTGAHKTVAVRLLSRVYPARTGRALGVMDTFGAFGGVVAPAAVVWALAAGGADWHVVFLGGGVAGLVLAGLFQWRVPSRLPPEPESEDEDGGSSAYRNLFSDTWFLVFVAVTILFSFTYNGAVAFLPLYLEDAAGLSPATAGTLYSGLFLVSLVQVVTGDVSDRLGRLTVIGGTLALATAGLALVVAVPRSPLPVLAGAVIAFGLGSHGFRPVRGAYLVELIPDSVAGGGLGVVRTLLMGVGAVAPAVVGIVSDVASFQAAFAVLLVSLAAGLALVGVLAVGGARA
nr:MFS transporter [Haloarchaeobius sp. HME9146]